MTGSARKSQVVDVDGTEVKISNPDKMFFPEGGLTKMDLVDYYLAVGPGALNGARDRPTTLHRFVDGVTGEGFYQKRIPKSRPEWIDSAVITFPSGRSAEMLAVADLAHIIWAVNLGCLELNPWPVRSDDVDHPDELRLDLDPTPEVSFGDVRDTAVCVREVLGDLGLTGFPKSSGKRGIHILVRIDRRWTFTEVRRAALAIAREVERRMPDVATTAWWKEERRGVFIDFNQNARDRTVASAYSIRPTDDARVSAPITWEEVPSLEPETLTVKTLPARFADIGDPHAEIDGTAAPLDQAIALSLRDEEEGLGDAPWPPHFPKMEGEPKRVQPSKAKKTTKKSASGKGKKT